MSSLTNTALRKLTFSDFVTSYKQKDPHTLATIDSLKAKCGELFSKNSNVSPGKLWQSLLFEFDQNQNSFGSCNVYDVFMCLMLAANLGVSINRDSHVYMYSRQNNKTKKLEPVLHLGYQALCRIAMNEGIIDHIECGIKYKGDKLSMNEGKFMYDERNEDIALHYADFNKIFSNEEKLKKLTAFVDYPYCVLTIKGEKQLVKLKEWIIIAESLLNKSTAVIWNFPEAMLQKMVIRRAISQIVASYQGEGEVIKPILDTLNLEEEIISLDTIGKEYAQKLGYKKENEKEEEFSSVSNYEMIPAGDHIKLVVTQQSQEDIEETYKILGI